MKGPLLVAVLFVIIKISSAKNLLFLNGMASPSHHIWNRSVMEAIAKRGYNLTIISPDIDKKPLDNMHYIHLENVYPTIYNGTEAMDIAAFASLPPLTSLLSINMFYVANCDGIYNSKGLDIISNYPDDFKFDAVIYDFTCGPCLLPLLHKFNYPPLIAVSAFSNPPYSTHLVGGDKYPAFVPHYVASDFLQDMTFVQRAYNSLFYFLDDISWYFVIREMEKKARVRYNFKDFPSLKELEERTAFMLVNSENAIDFPEPLLPNMIQVGGLQIQDPKDLSEDIKIFVESGKKGTILMSLGTNIKSNMLKKDTLKNILKTFQQFPDYNFLWKFESDESELPLKLSKNVMVKKFLPQNDILAHENIKAFITHGGLLSTQESFWYGKPMIGLPIFCDQHRTVTKSVALGAAVKLDILKLDVESFKKGINTILNDTKYTKNTERISKLFRDKPQKPIDTAVWWIEFVIRNPKTDHLKSPTLKLGGFASKSYDIFLCIILSIHLFAFIAFKILRAIYCRIKSIDSKKKNN